MGDSKIVDAYFPRELLERLDKAYPKRYDSRSAAIRDAVRKLLEELETKET